MRAFRVGHSPHSREGFVGLLARHGVERLVDVRRTPRSRRHPQFEGASLAAELPAGRGDYWQLAALGGGRRPRRDSPNGGWEHEAFRGYADHALTDEFADALAELCAVALELDGVHVRRGAVVALPPAPDRRPADRAGMVGLPHRRRRHRRQAFAAGVRDRRGRRDGPLPARAGCASLSSARGGCRQAGACLNVAPATAHWWWWRCG